VAKNIKKELKRPDEFVSFWTRFGEEASRVFAARKRAIIAGVTALATLVVGSIIFANVSERRSVRGTQALERVQKIATADLLPAGAPKPDAAKDAARTDDIPRFATEKERVTAALKELDGFLAAEPHSPLRAEAELQRGELLLSLDRADEAIAAYQGVLDGKLDERLRFLAHEGLGYAHERKGDLDRALTSFAKLGDDASGLPGFYKDRALYQKARISEVKGNREDAAKLYHEVLDKNPTTSLRDEITNRLAVLELK
jgi:tetratricopeptide (TPR) repeat protein